MDMKNPHVPDSNSSIPSTGSGRRSPYEKKIRIKVVGVGGAGVNAVDRLVMDGFHEVSVLAVNTDVQALTSSVVNEKLQIGENLTHGLGAGGDPEIGRKAALENIEQLRDILGGYDLIFIAAGMGGGTGTGAGPVVARVAREEGALVLALITLPFTHEGKQRAEIARDGHQAMEEAADAVICISNDRLLTLADEKTSVLNAFRPTDEFLSSGVRRIWQMLSRTGLINIDFADLCSVLRGRSGETLFGFGEGVGEKKLEKALEESLSSPLLSDSNILSKAESVLLGVTHGPDFTMVQLQRLMSELHQKMGPQTACKQGIIVDENYVDRLSIVMIASTGRILPKKNPSSPVEEKHSDSGKQKQTKKSLDSSESTIKNTSDSFFVDEMVHYRPNKKKGGVYEFIGSGPKQGTLKLDESTRGLFERVERTVVNGEDLDRPTFIRRGIVLKNVS